MACPPPLPPNRPPTRQRSNYPPITLRNKPSAPVVANPTPSSRTLSPRHSWTGGVSYINDTSPQVASLPSRSPLHGPLPVPPMNGPPPVPTSARPPLPPTPAPTPLTSVSSQSGSTTLFPSEDDKFTLTELVDCYSSIFPIKVCVQKGFYGDRGEDCAIAVDELYHFHFVKRSKVVSITDMGKSKYVVPLNSSAKFGVLYEHGTMLFGTVEDVMNAQSLPRVLGVTTGYVGNSPESSVQRYEVLVVKGVERGGRFRRKPPSLKVYSVTKNVEKNLTKEVFGKFSTDPFSTQMYLPEFLQHIPNPVPSQARLYLDFESDDPLPDFLTSESVTIQRLYVETSIIATSISEEDLEQNTISSGDTVDIPISLDIEVSVIPPAEDDDYEKIIYNTMNLLTHFDPSSATTHAVVEDEDEDYSAVAQQHLFKSVRKGFEKEGLNIETPTKIRSLTLKKQETTNGNVQSSSNSREGSEELDGYEDMDTIEQIRSEIPMSPLRHSAPKLPAPRNPGSRTPEPLPYQTPSSPTHNLASGDPPRYPSPKESPPPLPAPYQTPTSPTQDPTPPPPTTRRKSPPSPPQRPIHTLMEESKNVDLVPAPAGGHRRGRLDPGKFPPVDPNKVPGLEPNTALPSRSIKRPASASSTLTTGPAVSRKPSLKKQPSDPLPTQDPPPADYINKSASLERSGNGKPPKAPAVLPEIYENRPQLDTSDTVDTHDTRDLSNGKPPKAPAVLPEIYENRPQLNTSDTVDTHDTRDLSNGKPPKAPAVLPEIYENRPQLDTSDTVDTHDTHDLSRTVSSKAVDSLQSSLSDLSTRVRGLEQMRSLGDGGSDHSTVMPRLERVISVTEKLNTDVQALQEGMEMIRGRLEALADQVVRGGGGGTQGNGTECSNPELAVMDSGQIQKMLDLMGMAKYQQNFQEAGVDGDILSQCDDQILLEELSITSRLDRLKLLQVISGKRSVRSILQKSYVAFQPRN